MIDNRLTRAYKVGLAGSVGLIIYAMIYVAVYVTTELTAEIEHEVTPDGKCYVIETNNRDHVINRIEIECRRLAELK